MKELFLKKFPKFGNFFFYDFHKIGRAFFVQMICVGKIIQCIGKTLILGIIIIGNAALLRNGVYRLIEFFFKFPGEQIGVKAGIRCGN